MRGSIKTLAIAAIIFFGVGEFLGGWYIGIAGQTPMFLYKNTREITIIRRARTSSELPITLEGSLNQGRVIVEVTYERTASFQNPGQSVIDERRIFQQEYSIGEAVRLNELFREGNGTYRVRLRFEDATGLFRFDIPPDHQL